jgi:hypothetical protein
MSLIGTLLGQPLANREFKQRQIEALGVSTTGLAPPGRPEGTLAIPHSVGPAGGAVVVGARLCRCDRPRDRIAKSDSFDARQCSIKGPYGSVPFGSVRSPVHRERIPSCVTYSLHNVATRPAQIEDN